MTARVVCPVCGDKRIQQCGSYPATVDGVLYVDGTWKDADEGSDIFYEGYEMSGYRCRYCGADVPDPLGAV